MNTIVASAIEVMKVISWQLYCLIYSDLMKVWMLEMKGISQYRYITLMRKEDSHIKLHMEKQRCDRDYIGV